MPVAKRPDEGDTIMKRNAILLAALGVASFALLTGFTFARGHHAPFGFGHDPAKVAKFVTWKVNDTLDDLKATDVQRAKVLAVKDRLLSEGINMHQQHDTVHAEIERQWKADRMDVQQLRNLADQRMTEMRGFVYQSIDGLAEVHDALTPTQREQLLQEVEKMHGHP
jgi:periplasmic protein CpxP/Spy